MRKLKQYTPTKFILKNSKYDKAAADYAVGFIECLTHTKGSWAGKKFQLIDWQEQIVRDLFGILKPNGYRQFNTAYVEIPKKCGKSELAAAIALLLCCGDGEERAEVYGCAADRQQASIVFEVAADMVRMCPALNRRVKILTSTKRMIYLPTNSFYQVLSAEAYSKHGFNIHGVVFDELHTQPNRKLFDVMTKGSGDARTQPLYFLITTAGNDTESICFETHQKALDILEGRKTDPTFYPVIYGAKDDEDWTSPEVWKKANPSLGITFGIDKVQAACDSARQNPGEENSFRQLRLNQWVKQSVRWMPMEKWDACNFEVNPDELEGRVCYGGLDLSSTTDITAFVLVFPPQNENEKFFVLPYFWIPEENIDLRVRRDHVQYDKWQKQKFFDDDRRKCRPLRIYRKIYRKTRRKIQHSRNCLRQMGSDSGGTKFGKCGLYGRSFRSRFPVDVAADKKIDEIGFGEKNCSRRSARFALEYGQYFYQARPRRKYKN